MNLEENRLQTFNNWPSNAAINPQRLAKAGFFSTNQGLEVECFACHIKITEWNYGDGVMARHIALRPDCPFVLNPLTSGNVPIISPSNIRSNSVNLYRESPRLRLASFETWPISDIVSPERLANAGFYYLKEGDNTKCPFCKGVVRAWEPGDDPDSEHQRHFPNCQFVIDVINPRLQVNNGDGANHSNTNSRIEKESFPNITLVGDQQNFDELGVQAHKGPKSLDYLTVESRLRSFGAWSPDLVQTPDVLSQAGFYYEGLGDQVRCFHCDGGLRHWDPHDDPWTEHARWFPNCSFVKLAKGQEFVTACSHNAGQVGSSIQKPMPRRVRRERVRRQVSEREMQEFLSSPQALAALNIGLNLERVKRAIMNQIRITGRPFSQADALVEAALNLQRDEEDFYDSDNRSGSSSSSTDNVRQALFPMPSETEKETRGSTTPNVSITTPTPTVDNTSSTDNSESLPTEKYVSLEDENRIIQEARLCKICMNMEMGIVFLPCGHLATCVDCALNMEHCPVCRSSIKATVRTFFS